MERPRVFISCAQGSSVERHRAEQLKKIVHSAGFEPFVAVEGQWLSGFMEVIVARLQSSEYFLFVDTPRETLVGRRRRNAKAKGRKEQDRRGSLFCQQELAVAAAFDLEIAAFAHKTVKREGVLAFVMANAVEFRSDDALYEAVKQKVKGWSKNWRNELRFELPQAKLSEHSVMNSAGMHETYYNIQVANRHKSRAAFNCYAYLESCHRLAGSEEREMPLQSIEFAWAGATYANALIQPQQPRLLNVCVRNARGVELCVTTTYSGFRPLLEVGEYILNFIVYSQNFLPARGKSKLIVQSNNVMIEPLNS